jgi:hypothetical protein
MAACVGDGCWRLLERRPGDLRQLRRLSRWRTATNDEPLHVHGPNIAVGSGGCSGVQAPSCRVDLSAAATCRTRRRPVTRAAQPFLACARSKGGVAH